MIDIEKTIEYLHKYIDEAAEYIEYNETAEKKLSAHLADSFHFYKVELFGEKVLFLKPTEKYTIAKIQKWMAIIESKTNLQTAVILDEATPYIIKKMLMERVAFVVPGRQINLPFLAMRIKSEKQHVGKEMKRFTPGTQLIYLSILYAEKENFDIETVAKKLNISQMTALRGLNALTGLNLLICDVCGKTGRKKIFRRIDMKDYYAKGKKYLDNPVKDVVYISRVPDGCRLIRSGLTALAEQTMLSEPEQESFALYWKNRAILNPVAVLKEQATEENLPIVQLFKYNVELLEINGYIDPVSMILGLEEKDERIEVSIEELMENRKWYMA